LVPILRHHSPPEEQSFELGVVYRLSSSERPGFEAFLSSHQLFAKSSVWPGVLENPLRQIRFHLEGVVLSIAVSSRKYVSGQSISKAK
jgi:hypothetical protein